VKTKSSNYKKIRSAWKRVSENGDRYLKHKDKGRILLQKLIGSVNETQELEKEAKQAKDT